MKQHMPIINVKGILIEKTLKLVKHRKAKKNGTKVCHLTKISKS